MGLALGLVLMRLLLLSGKDAIAVRPWATFVAVDRQLVEQKGSAGQDAEKLTALARWCASKGLFREMEEALLQALKKEPGNAGARALLGQRQGPDGAWVEEEAARFSALPTNLAAMIPSPSAKDRQRLLAQKDRELRMAVSSNYFDLWTDLDSEPLKRYTDQLNGYYRALKNRFMAYAGGNIDVLVFSTRSDFLRFYAKRFGQRGEHIGGFYLPDNRLLVFYDDPYDLDTILDTARHECTHLLLDLGYSGAPLPLWLDEGMACFLASDDITSSDPYLTGLIAELLDQLRANSAVPLEKLLELERSDFKFPQYALAWSWIHFLNQPEQAPAFQRFLDRLRHEVPRERRKDQEIDAYRKECRSKTNALFRSVVAADPRALQDSWRRYFSDAFALTTAQQLADFGWSCYGRAVATEKSDEKLRALGLAQDVFAGVATLAGDGKLGVDATQGKVLCMVQRVSTEANLSVGAQRLFLRTALEAIARLPDDADGEGAWLRGRLAGRMLLAFRKIAVKNVPEHAAFDCRKAVVDVLSAQDDALHRALIANFDDVLKLAFESLARALAKNPLRARAAHDWLELAMDLAPDRVADVFPILKLLVEKDPDDRNLAALGLAYLGLGDKAVGKMLIEEAKERSVNPESLASFVAYFEQ
jgi:hypothetical protein